MELINHLRYSLYIIFRPFDGFWDLKHEKRGSLLAGNIILVILIVTYILKRQATGFLFNNNYIKELNIFMEMIGILLPFLLWCVSNWCITTLTDGKAKFGEIAMVTAYAMTPLIIINLPMIVVSNVITADEGAFYHFFLSLSVFWSMGLLLVGTMVIQQYTLSKTLFTTIITVIGMGVMIFLALLFFSLIQQMYQYVLSIYNEIVFRL